MRILDLSWGIAGPVGVWLLAEQGADVVKVEPPGGDPFRAQPGAPVWHRSRRSIELDLTTDGGRAAWADLVASADVVVEAFAPGTARRLGIDHATLAAAHPHLVVCSVPAYPEGHRAAGRAGYDALVQARSGLQWEQPGWRPGPVHLHFPAPSFGAAFLVATGVLAALVARQRTGRGQHVRTSLYQGVLAFTTQIWQEHERADADLRLMMGKTYPPGVHQASIYECAGGEWIHAATMNGLQPTRSLEDVLGVEAPDPLALFTDPSARAAHDDRLRAAFRRRDRDGLVEELHAAGLGAEPIVPMRDALAHPQLVANGMVARVDDPALGPTTQVGVPIRLSATPGAVQGPQPPVGQHTAEVLAEAAARARASGPGRGPSAPVPPPAGEPPAPGAGPLAGMRVLDLGQYLAGPFGAMVLADLGADVIKVEPTRGDGMRIVGKPFIGCQRGKRGLAVDLKTEAGRDLVLRLAETADVVLHNMTKGTAERLGLGEAAFRARNPAVVHCNTYAYGPEGPLSHFGGLDPLYQAVCGLEYEAGAVAQGNAPLYLRFGMVDTANALASVVGILAALVHRGETGEGQDVWTSLLNGGAIFGSDVVLTADGRAHGRPGLDAGLHGLSPCYRLYETQDGWIQVAAVTPEAWRALCETLGCGDLAGDERCATVADRIDHRAELEPRLESAFRAQTAVAWRIRLDAAGVPAEVAVDTNDGELALHDADNERLGLVVEYEHPRLGRLRQLGRLIDFSATPFTPHRPPPLLGQHTREVMRAAGYDDANIDRLVAEAVVSEPGDDDPWPL
ncbi:MAG TPA: CoA transferase [Acidimicrobiales bacterium]|nr:CoA transferase [Acidimicrobiales bacterium]